MTIKLWDNTNPNKTFVVQTLTGSGGMVNILLWFIGKKVLDLIYIAKIDTLISIATDKKFRIWK